MESDLYKENSDILFPDKGKFRFDNFKECVEGHEYLWNVTGWKRGSIVIILKRDEVNFIDIYTAPEVTELLLKNARTYCKESNYYSNK